MKRSSSTNNYILSHNIHHAKLPLLKKLTRGFMSSISPSALFNRFSDAYDKAEMIMLEKAFHYGPHIAVSLVIGNISGRLTQTSSMIGMSQGFVTGLYHTLVHIQAQKQVAKRTGEKKQIKPNIANHLKMVLMICEFVIPILISLRICDPLKKLMVDKMPRHVYVDTFLLSVQKREYHLLTAVAHAILALIALNSLSYMRKDY